jgi:hypothetical protein
MSVSFTASSNLKGILGHKGLKKHEIFSGTRIASIKSMKIKSIIFSLTLIAQFQVFAESQLAPEEEVSGFRSIGFMPEEFDFIGYKYQMDSITRKQEYEQEIFDLNIEKLQYDYKFGVKNLTMKFQHQNDELLAQIEYFDYLFNQQYAQLIEGAPYYNSGPEVYNDDDLGNAKVEIDNSLKADDSTRDSGSEA